MSRRHVSLASTLTIISVESHSSLSDILGPHVVFGALYDSAVREGEHTITCQPETRTKVLEDIRSWADSTTATPMCWLSGPAGTGKTTVAHTIAEEYDKRGQLAATLYRVLYRVFIRLIL